MSNPLGEYYPAPIDVGDGEVLAEPSGQSPEEELQAILDTLPEDKDKLTLEDLESPQIKRMAGILEIDIDIDPMSAVEHLNIYLTAINNKPDRTDIKPSEIGYTSDSFQQFINEMGKHKLLTAAQERDLASQKDVFMPYRLAVVEEAESRGVVTQEEWDQILADKIKDLAPEKQARIMQGRRAFELMVNSNLRLVISIAKNFSPPPAMTRMDLIIEGTIGLNRAVEKFDWRRGFKFSTYATWWIRQAVARSIADKGRTIRIPVHVYERLGKIRRATGELTSALGRDATDAEVAEELGISVDEVIYLTKQLNQPTSLDKPIGEGDYIDASITLQDLQLDKATPSTEDQVANSIRVEQLDGLLKSLPERQRTIITHRHEVGGAERMTFQELGDMLGITRERVRQLEKDGLAKMESEALSLGITDDSVTG